MTTPYTYLIKHIPTGKVYYGCRYAEGCHPSDLWITYKTSSKYVRELIEQYGAESFHFEVRKIFNDKNSCRMWESKVLRRMKVVSRDDFLNKTDNLSIDPTCAAKGRKGKFGIFKLSQQQIENIKKTNTGLKRSEEVKKKMSDAMKGRTAPNKGVPHSIETKEKMSQAKLGRKRPDGHGDKMRIALTGRKLYINEQGQKKFFFPGTEPIGFSLKTKGEN